MHKIIRTEGMSSTMNNFIKLCIRCDVPAKEIVRLIEMHKGNDFDKELVSTFVMSLPEQHREKLLSELVETIKRRSGPIPESAKKVDQILKHKETDAAQDMLKLSFCQHPDNKSKTLIRLESMYQPYTKSILMFSDETGKWGMAFYEEGKLASAMTRDQIAQHFKSKDAIIKNQALVHLCIGVDLLHSFELLDLKDTKHDEDELIRFVECRINELFMNNGELLNRACKAKLVSETSSITTE